ncbi:MAG: hypothetical protein JWL76_2338 [Thermoleophilia bacterium]|nr:hypothetical protein [Thermoleophilia bacterium]
MPIVHRLALFLFVAACALAPAAAAHAVTAPVDRTWTHPPIPDANGLKVELVRPDGAILFSTGDTNGTFDPNDDIRRLRQLDLSGRPDRSFSGDGLLDLTARQHLLLFDGQEFLTDRRVYTRELGWRSNVELRRYRADGTIDRTWGSNGVSELWLIAPWDADPTDGDRDDEVCGGWPTSRGFTILVLDGQRALNLLHITERGVPDTSVGEQGWTRTQPPAALPLAISSCFRTVPLAGGSLLMRSRGSDAARTERVARINIRTETFDTTWGTGGLLATGSFSDQTGGSSIVPTLQLPDGRIIAKRYVDTITREEVPGHGTNITTVTQVGIVALRLDGTLDPTFGDDGVVKVATIRPPRAEGDVMPLLTLHRGRLVTMVSRENGDQLPPPSVHRYLLDGTPDPEFGVGGRVDIGRISGIVAVLDSLGGLVVHDLSEEHQQFRRYRTDVGDLAVSKLGLERQSETFTARVRIRSLGPLAAMRVVLVADLPAGVSQVRAALPGGACRVRASAARTRVACTLSRLLVSDHADLQLRGTASSGPLPIRVHADSSTPDLRAANDTVAFGAR